MGIVAIIVAVCIKVVDLGVGVMWHIEYIPKVKAKI
jgi:gamma-glutamyl-gamma-aminobutyrate hydrolase PuuD